LQSLLGTGDKFKALSGYELQAFDGCYLHLDEDRSVIARYVQAPAGFEKRQRNMKNHPCFMMVPPRLEWFTRVD
jgi:hypothetical protein